MRFPARSLTLAIFGLASSPPAHAQVNVVVPNVYTNTVGGGVSAVPIDIQGHSWTIQLVYNQNQLTDLLGQDITGIAYRRGAPASGGGYPLQTTTWSNYVVRLGPSVAPTAATGTYASNFTAAPSQVRSGSWTVPPFAWPNNGPPGPNPWGPVLTFDTPYHYTGGNLAMLITHSGSDNPNIGNALMETTTSTSTGMGSDYVYYANTGFDVSSGSASGFMPVVQFTAVQSVPEPASCLLIGAVVIALGATRRTPRCRGLTTPFWPEPLAPDLGGSDAKTYRSEEDREDAYHPEAGSGWQTDCHSSRFARLRPAHSAWCVAWE
jgi:hypothetical protein